MEQPARQLSRSDAGILALLLGANLVALVPEIMMGALYPALAARYAVSLETVVLLTTPRALGQFGVLFLGPLSQRIGWARLLVGGLILAAAAAWGGALASGLGVMAVLQVAMGLALAIGNAGIPALAGDRFAYAVRGRALAIIRLAMPLTLIVVVPCLVALASRVGVRAPFVALGLAATAIAALSAWRLPAAAGRPARGADSPLPRRLPVQVFALLALALCLQLVPASVFSFLSAWIGETFGNPGVTVGLVIACDGVGALLGVGLSAAFVDRLTKRRAALLGLAVAGAFALLLPAAGRALGLACLTIAGLSASLEVAFVALVAMLTELAPRARGTVMGLWAGALAAGTALSPLASRPLWTGWGMAGLGWAGGGLLAVLAVALLLVVAEPGSRVGTKKGLNQCRTD